VKPPRISSRECIRALEKIGFRFVSQSGSHIKIRRDEPHAVVIVPEKRELAPGTLRSILKQAGLSIEEFIELL
jgi:predicted RNA binding protein YcfA (HicA-like mRNA interferase family)